MKHHTGTFEAVGSDHETYAVLEFTNDIDAGTPRDPHAVVGGLKEYRTSGGLAVIRVRKGEYKMVKTGVSLRSDSPDAP